MSTVSSTPSESFHKQARGRREREIERRSQFFLFFSANFLCPLRKPQKTGPARGFGYSVSWAFLFQVYGIFWSKFAYKVFSFS